MNCRPPLLDTASFGQADWKCADCVVRLRTDKQYMLSEYSALVTCNFGGRSRHGTKQYACICVFVCVRTTIDTTLIATYECGFVYFALRACACDRACLLTHSFIECYCKNGSHAYKPYASQRGSISAVSDRIRASEPSTWRRRWLLEQFATACCRRHRQRRQRRHRRRRCSCRCFTTRRHVRLYRRLLSHEE